MARKKKEFDPSLREYARFRPDFDSASHDELAERAYMRRQKVAKDKLARLRLIKMIAG